MQKRSDISSEKNIKNDHTSPGGGAICSDVRIGGIQLLDRKS